MSSLRVLVCHCLAGRRRRGKGAAARAEEERGGTGTGTGAEVKLETLVRLLYCIVFPLTIFSRGFVGQEGKETTGTLVGELGVSAKAEKGGVERRVHG